MKTANLTIPEVGLVAVTRAVLGIGIGLLIHDKLRAGQRAPIGWTCLAAGLLTTIPLARGSLRSHTRVMRAGDLPVTKE